MPVLPPSDEDLVRRLPLPLAQLYRRAHNAKTALERQLTAFYLWEAGLKLLGSAAIVCYAGHETQDPQLAERLTNHTASGHEALTLKGHTDYVFRVAFSRDGQRLVSASKDGTIKVWDASPVQILPRCSRRMPAGSAGKDNGSHD